MVSGAGVDECSSGSRPCQLCHSRRLAGEARETCGVEKSSSGGLAKEPFQHAGQSWDCSQVENKPEETVAVDWLVDDELRLWEVVSKDEQGMTSKRSEGRDMQVEQVHSAPGLVVHMH